MRAAFLIAASLVSCGGSSAEQRPPERQRSFVPYADCAGPMARKCAGWRAAGSIERTPAEARQGLAQAETPDAVEAGPLVYRVVFDNDWVRVLSVRYAAGKTVPLHTHPDRVVYDVATGAARFEKAGMHVVDAAAPRVARELVVELGSQPGAAVPAGDDPVATYPRLFKLLLDEKRVRVLAVTFGKGTSKPVALGDHVLVSRDKGTLTVSPASGQARVLALEPGKVELFPAGVYTATNPKKESFEVVVVELKVP